MKLMHPLFSSPIVFAENKIQVLTVEHAPMFRELASGFISQMEGENGGFVLSKDDAVLDCGACLHVITDYVHLEALDKRMQSKLLSLLLQDAQEELAEDTLHATRELHAYLGKLAAMADYPVEYDRSENIAALLKAMNFRIDLSGMPAHEALYEHISLCSRVMKNPCFVLVHAKAFFSTDELRGLYDMARYRKWNLLLLESHSYPIRIEGEEHRLFDQDLCELVLDKMEITL